MKSSTEWHFKMEKIRFGITGQSGFIGSWLYRKAVVSGQFSCTEFHRNFFDDPQKLHDFAANCDVIVHLAGLSRHEDGEFLYRTNVELTGKLIRACDGRQKILLGSTTHEAKNLPYHASKRKSRELLETYGNTTALLMANTFGPGGKPYYNSVVSTFCRMAADGLTPEKVDPVMLQLIFIDDLCAKILEIAEKREDRNEAILPHTHEYSLPRIWETLSAWSKGKFPALKNEFETNLYITFKSYLERN